MKLHKRLIGSQQSQVCSVTFTNKIPTLIILYVHSIYKLIEDRITIHSTQNKSGWLMRNFIVL